MVISWLPPLSVLVLILIATCEDSWTATKRLITNNNVTNLIVLLQHSSLCLSPIDRIIATTINVAVELIRMSSHCSESLNQIIEQDVHSKYAVSHHIHDCYVVDDANIAVSSNVCARMRIEGLTSSRDHRFSIVMWQSGVLQDISLLDKWLELQPSQIHQCNESACHTLYEYKTPKTFSVNVQKDRYINYKDGKAGGPDVRIAKLFARIMHRHVQFVVYMLARRNNLTQLVGPEAA